jgi:hypothetical protein
MCWSSSGEKEVEKPSAAGHHIVFFCFCQEKRGQAPHSCMMGILRVPSTTPAQNHALNVLFLNNNHPTRRDARLTRTTRLPPLAPHNHNDAHTGTRTDIAIPTITPHHLVIAHYHTITRNEAPRGRSSLSSQQYRGTRCRTCRATTTHCSLCTRAPHPPHTFTRTSYMRLRAQLKPHIRTARHVSQTCTCFTTTTRSAATGCNRRRGSHTSVSTLVATLLTSSYSFVLATCARAPCNTLTHPPLTHPRSRRKL